MYKHLLKLSIVLVLIVVILGTYTRLSDAGLSCPDWPGCYGQLTVPSAPDGTKIEGYDRPLEVSKGYKEMVHRYAASILGLVILLLWWQAFKQKPIYRQSMPLPTFAVFFVILQGAFGMWTVTLLVHPGIVTLHLLGGFVTTSVLFWLFLNQKILARAPVRIDSSNKILLLVVLTVLIFQITLGGWTSTHYAALSCGEQFPACLGTYWPDMDLSKAFYWGPLGVDYEYGVLEGPARVGIQMMHRIGALTTAVLMLLFVYRFRHYAHLKSSLLVTGGLLALQVTLGILNVLLSLPMIIAVLHNVVALLLLLSVLNIIHKVFKNQTQTSSGCLS
ncbi:COX15/CtaA family protein [Candidatus Thioglobus sp.]|uniref:COX15/CtaA family protein n=1 Tax=Candidatus Thioglobus sp. TaxID=2026721 RepID=UPI003D0CA69C